MLFSFRFSESVYTVNKRSSLCLSFSHRVCFNINVTDNTSAIYFFFNNPHLYSCLILQHSINTAYIPSYRGRKHVTEDSQQTNSLTLLQFKQVHLMRKAIIKACILSIGLCNPLQYVNPRWIWRILAARRVPLNGVYCYFTLQTNDFKCIQSF